MLRVYAEQYIDMGERIGGAKAIYTLTEPQIDDPHHEGMSLESRKGIADDLAQMQRLCNELDLPVAFKMVKKHREPIPVTLREYGMLVDAVYLELEGRLFLYVPSDAVSTGFHRAGSSQFCGMRPRHAGEAGFAGIPRKRWMELEGRPATAYGLSNE